MKIDKIRFATIRMCDACGYRTVNLKDDLRDKDCKHCYGKLEIIAKSKKKIKKLEI